MNFGFFIFYFISKAKRRNTISTIALNSKQNQSNVNEILTPNLNDSKKSNKMMPNEINEITEIGMILTFPFH